MSHVLRVLKSRCWTVISWSVLLAFLPVSATAQEEPPLREAFPKDDFVLREEMIPMRDGVELYTIIAMPKNPEKKLPMLLTRTPYDATRFFRGPASTHLGIYIGDSFLGDDYIYVSQDIRGRFKSKGEYTMFRPPRGAFNDSETDHSTDTWDTIEWLVDNIESNGRVGVWGTSYPGWLTLAAIKEPHPALAAAVPCNPVVDVWKADDWFHWGAFRGAFALGFIYDMQTRTDKFADFPYEKRDLYQFLLEQGSFGSALGGLLDDRHEMWTRIMENPAYGPVWRAIAADQWFDSPDRLVPTLHVHGLWDQEDIYGSPAVYAAMEEHDLDNDTNYFVAGPWYHGQHFGTGDKLGSITFDESTAVRFRQEALQPFLRRYLHGESGAEIAPVTVFETGSNRWREFDSWPPEGRAVRLYLQPDGGLAWQPPEAASSATHFVSDPSKPVPFAPRPNWAVDYSQDESVASWRRWQVEDQRFVDGRPDVLTWVSEPLEVPLTVRGPVRALLVGETTGTDVDWVVKLIDVFPDPAPRFVMSGYQLMISGEIFRGRYREDLENPKPVTPGKALEYAVSMPQVNHTFLPGHRLMIQIQSTWFPLYDRNPQTWVDSIMYAPEGSYTPQQHSIHHEKSASTYLELRVDLD